MEEFVELGLEGADKLIDRHFHRVPDKAFSPDTYNPMNISIPHRQKSRKDSKDTQADHDPESSPDRKHSQSHSRSKHRSRRGSVQSDTQSMSRRSGTDNRLVAPSYPPNSPYETPQLYSREPPHQRPEYLPSPPPSASASANPYYTPSASRPINPMAMNRGRDVDPYDDDYHSDSYRAPRRPKAVTRRSSSYHGPRDKDNYGYGQQVSRRHGSGSERVDRYSDRARDAAHKYGLKEDMNSVFTATKTGLAGGAVGAAVGGWAAQKAQVGYLKDGHKRDPNPVLTLLGATVGGLAINAVVDKWQDGKKETETKQKKWEEKFGSDDESDGGRSRRSHRSRQRSRRDSYDY